MIRVDPEKLLEEERLQHPHICVWGGFVRNRADLIEEPIEVFLVKRRHCLLPLEPSYLDGVLAFAANDLDVQAHGVVTYVDDVDIARTMTEHLQVVLTDEVIDIRQDLVLLPCQRLVALVPGVGDLIVAIFVLLELFARDDIGDLFRAVAELFLRNDLARVDVWIPLGEDVDDLVWVGRLDIALVGGQSSRRGYDLDSLLFDFDAERLGRFLRSTEPRALVQDGVVLLRGLDLLRERLRVLGIQLLLRKEIPSCCGDDCNPDYSHPPDEIRIHQIWSQMTPSTLKSRRTDRSFPFTNSWPM